MPNFLNLELLKLFYNYNKYISLAFIVNQIRVILQKVIGLNLKTLSELLV